MIVREIIFGSDEYSRALCLREEVLRKPLGLSLWNEDLSREEHQVHVGLFHPDGELVACVVAVPGFSDEAKVRQMAVAISHQRCGCGQKIMRGMEANLAERGIRRLVLHARVSAVGFYQKMGYAVTGKTFLEVGIPHLKMGKDLPLPGA
jgi:predicted GNAT family N-acyltransferase